MLNHLQTRLKDFVDDTRGSITVEFVIMFPLMLWGFGAMFVFFDAFRTTSVNQKAAFTIADMLSRETEAIDNTYISNTRLLFDHLTSSDTPSKMRISVLYWDEDDNQFNRDWSQTRGSVVALTNATLSGWTDKLPIVPDNERIILVETWSPLDPLFEVGISEGDIETFVFTSPRFAPRLPWDS